MNLIRLSLNDNFRTLKNRMRKEKNEEQVFQKLQTQNMHSFLIFQQLQYFLIRANLLNVASLVTNVTSCFWGMCHPWGHLSRCYWFTFCPFMLLFLLLLLFFKFFSCSVVIGILSLKSCKCSSSVQLFSYCPLVPLLTIISHYFLGNYLLWS